MVAIETEHPIVQEEAVLLHESGTSELVVQAYRHRYDYALGVRSRNRGGVSRQRRAVAMLGAAKVYLGRLVKQLLCCAGHAYRCSILEHGLNCFDPRVGADRRRCWLH